MGEQMCLALSPGPSVAQSFSSHSSLAQPRHGLAYVPTDHIGVAEGLAQSQEHHRVSAAPPTVQPYTLRSVMQLELSSFVPVSLRTKALRRGQTSGKILGEGCISRANLVPRARHAVFRGHLLADRGMCDSGGRAAWAQGSCTYTQALQTFYIHTHL